MENRPQDSLVGKNSDKFIGFLNNTVIYCVKLLALAMTLTIFWSLADVFIHLYKQYVTSFHTFFSTESLFAVLGSFLAVLITIEIYMNIIFYLKEDAIHVPLVLATALTAVARKVIILDYATTDFQYILAISAAIFSLGISYWLITKKS